MSHYYLGDTFDIHGGGESSRHVAGRLVVPMMAGGALLLVLGVALGAVTEAGMSFAMGAYLTAFTYV